MNDTSYSSNSSPEATGRLVRPTSLFPFTFPGESKQRSGVSSEVKRSLRARYHMAAAARLVHGRLSAAFHSSSARPSLVPRCSCGESGLLRPTGSFASPPPAADQCQQPYGRRLVGITISAAGISLGRRAASATPRLLRIFPPLHVLLHFCRSFPPLHRIIWC